MKAKINPVLRYFIIVILFAFIIIGFIFIMLIPYYNEKQFDIFFPQFK